MLKNAASFDFYEGQVSNLETAESITTTNATPTIAAEIDLPEDGFGYCEVTVLAINPTDAGKGYMARSMLVFRMIGGVTTILETYEIVPETTTIPGASWIGQAPSGSIEIVVTGTSDTIEWHVKYDLQYLENTL